MPPTITKWASELLADALDALQLCNGVTTEWTEQAVVGGEVSVFERKGKKYPVYSLEVVLPWSGLVDGASCAGVVRLPDISLEMLDDLEVSIESTEGAAPALLQTEGGVVVQSAVRAWAAAVRKVIADDGEIPWDEAEPPYTEKEVRNLLIEARQAIAERFSPESAEEQFGELEREIADKDLQEAGRVLTEVAAYLQETDLQEAEQGGMDDDPRELGEPLEPYSGPEALEQLWLDVCKLVRNEEDLGLLEEEMGDKPPEEQWKVLLDVRDHYLSGEEEEQEAFEQWEPTDKDLEEEWGELRSQVPVDDVAEVQRNWDEANAVTRKAIVWDVRLFVEEQNEVKRRAAEESYGDAGRSEMRQRGGKARRGPDGDEEDEDDRRARARRSRQRPCCMSRATMAGMALVCLASTLVLAAVALAGEDESTLSSLTHLLHLR